MDIKKLQKICELGEAYGYETFEIPKRSGGVRTIEAPNDKLKEKQRSLLLKELSYVDRFKPSYFSHSFMHGRNIVTCAKPHVGKKYLGKIDIKDFFTSIKFSEFCGEIEGHYYNKNGVKIQRHTIDDETKKELLKWCWRGTIEFGEKKYSDLSDYYKEQADKLGLFDIFDNLYLDIKDKTYLPQGAPTSPILSNAFMRDFDWKTAWLCAKPAVDKHLEKKNVVYYSRYADDLFFSSDEFFWLDKVMKQAKSYLRHMGLEINKKKVNVFGPGKRKMVCGLVVNEKLNLPKEKRKLVRAIKHRKEFEEIGEYEKGLLAFDYMVNNQDKFPDNNVDVIKTSFVMGKV